MSLAGLKVRGTLAQKTEIVEKVKGGKVFCRLQVGVIMTDGRKASMSNASRYRCYTLRCVRITVFYLLALVFLGCQGKVDAPGDDGLDAFSEDGGGFPEDGGDFAGEQPDASAVESDDGEVDSGDASADSDHGSDAADGACVDTCPYADGVLYGCQRRFMYGVNWAWKRWCGDFGGISAWGFMGVAADRQAFSADLAQMKAAGASVIRWWMFPRFLSESILWNADDTPSGIGGTLVADIQAALELAQEHDVYLMLTPFSFDNFYPTSEEGGILSRSIRPMVVDAEKRQRLLENLVRPVARAVQQSPYRRRLIAWDLINEPEWAMTGPNMYGGEDFEPNPDCEAVTHAQMKTFLDELAAVFRQETPGALITVGGAAIKWGTAWKEVDQDFYSLHYYDWVYQWYPYETVTPESIGLTGKPVVIGEYPIQGLSAVGGQPARTPAQYSADMWRLGYGGTLAWAFNDPSFPWNPTRLGEFSDQHPCETAYRQ